LGKVFIRVIRVIRGFFSSGSPQRPIVRAAAILYLLFSIRTPSSLSEGTMRSAILCTAALVLVGFVGVGHTQDKKDPYAEHIASTEPRSPAEEQKGFHLPPGFEMQLVASDPDIHKPMNLAFDDRGRLWLTESVEYPFPAGPGHKPRDAVKILDDFAPDGKARKITTFADGLNIPIGILPLPGAKPQEALLYSIPNIYRLRDTTGIGYADERAVLYSRYGFRDTHGMTSAFTWGFDGWIYACHGFSNTSTVTGADGKPITMQSGNTYRMKTDGSHLEYFTHGQVNPFGLSFDPLGNLYSCDCHTQPIMQLLRGGYYQSFGKPHDGLGFAPEMISRYDDSTAIAGITYYAADNFPKAYRDTAFVGDVVTHNIVQFELEWHGSTPKATLKYFLKSDDPWFRPVDIKLGPDGALYVADFYNRIIGHYEVPLTHPGRDRERGRIWRIVYTGKDNTGTPAPRSDWTKASTADLVQDLGHPNLTVRLKAANQLVERGGKPGIEAVQAVMHVPENDSQTDAWRRVHGLWVLQRQGALEDSTLAAAAKDKDRAVRVHAQRVLAECGKWSASERGLVLAGLKDRDPNVQRAAADALGRHPEADNLRPLLDLRHAVPKEDTHLLHVVRMALRDQLRDKTTWAKLPLEPWAERDELAVADVSLGVPSPEAADFLLRYLEHRPKGFEDIANPVHHVARYGEGEAGKKLLALARGSRPEDLLHQVALYRAIEQGTQERGGKVNDDVQAWGVELTAKLLVSKQPRELLAGVELAGSLKLESQQNRLVEMALTKAAPEDQRRAALGALVALNARKNAPVLGTVLGDAEAPVGLREHAANLLAGANQPETQALLLQGLATAPARLQTVIAAGLARSRTGAEKLLEAVEAGKASARLLQERPVEFGLNAAKPANWQDRLAKLTKGLPKADERIQELLGSRRKGFLAAKPDREQGAKVYEKNCAICHQLGGKGAKIGPQLDGIGLRGLDRLLEDTLDPNRNVDQAFRATSLELNDGKVVLGLLLKEEGEVYVMADAQGKEVRVSKNTVAEKKVSPLSPMPANFADQIPEADFYHLMAFLLAQQAPPERKP
jgi:putative heme-binding domain-containing protein